MRTGNLLKRIITDRAALDGMVREWATIAHTAREDALNRNDKTAVAALAREAWTYEACATQLRRHLDGDWRRNWRIPSE